MKKKSVPDLPAWVTKKISEHGSVAVTAAIRAAAHRRLEEEIYRATLDMSIVDLQSLVGQLK